MLEAMRPAPSAFRETDPRDRGRDPWRAPGGGAGGPPPLRPGGREPAIRAPWPALALAGLVVVAWLAQIATGEPLAVADRFGFRPQALTAGGWTGLFTALFVHAGWTHALLNALACLAFGAPVAKRFGVRGAGPAAFALFYVVCGVIGSLGFAALSGGGEAVLVGASGAIAGLMGAASRMVPPHDGPLARLWSPPVLTMAGAWLAVNLVFAVAGLGVATGGAPLAWQAHLAGYAAGVLGIGPALALVRPSLRRA